MFMNSSRSIVNCSQRFTNLVEFLQFAIRLPKIVREVFMNIREHFANVHVHITSRPYVHEQFTKYHELFVKVRELGGNFFLQPTVLISSMRD